MDGAVGVVMSGKRIEAKELRCNHRQSLQDLIPLAAPFVIYIDPTNLCNFRCKFCPTSDEELLRSVNRPKKIMPLDLYSKIIDDIARFDAKLKLLSLYKDGEPLLNPNFSEMVRLAKNADIAERIWTKTNGSLLKPELNRKMIDAGLDHICISIEAVSSQGYLDIAGIDIDYAALVSNIEDLYLHRGNCEIYVKIADVNLTDQQKAKFYSDFQPISTHIGIEKLMGWSNSGVKDFTLGTNPETYDGLPFTDKEVCAYPFYVMAVNSDGTVSVCGNDWSQQTVVGDATKQSLQDIWHGEHLYQFRIMMLNKDRKLNKACGECYYLRIVPDNIDDSSKIIIDNLKDSRRAHGG